MRLLLAALLLLLAAALPAARAQEIKLATWNIAWLTARAPGDADLPRSLVPRTSADFQALARYARQLDADVIALQEVDGPEAAARVFDPGTYAFFFARESDVQRTGFAVRRTLRATQNEDLAALDTRPQARRSLRRGTDVTVHGEGRANAPALRLLSVHLNAGCQSGPLDRADGECETLSRQAEILAGWVAARRREGAAFAILGDFNRRMASGGAPDAFLLALAGPQTPLARATEGQSDPCWAGPRGPRAFIDHILLGGAAERWWQRDSLRVLVYAERDAAAWRERLSDHCPVSIRLRLPTAAAGG